MITFRTEIAPRRSLLIFAVALTIAFTGCSKDDSVSDSPSTTESVTDSSAADATESATDTAADTTAATAATTPLTGEEICARIGADALGATIGRPVDNATADRHKCEFTYPASEGNVYFITVGDATGDEPTPSERFDAAAAIYGEGLASTPLTAGDKALKLGEGPTVLGLVLVGEHVFYVYDLPEVALEPQLEPLLQLVATKLA